MPGPDELDPRGPDRMWVRTDAGWQEVDKVTGYRLILNGTAKAFAMYKPTDTEAGSTPANPSKGLSRGIQLRNKVRGMSADTMAEHLAPMAVDLEDSDVPRLLDLFAQEA